jgi:hypothetical protein
VNITDDPEEGGGDDEDHDEDEIQYFPFPAECVEHLKQMLENRATLALEADDLAEISRALKIVRRLPKYLAGTELDITLSASIPLSDPEGGLTSEYIGLDISAGEATFKTGGYLVSPGVGGDSFTRTAFWCDLDGSFEGDLASLEEWNSSLANLHTGDLSVSVWGIEEATQGTELPGSESHEPERAGSGAASVGGDDEHGESGEPSISGSPGSSLRRNDPSIELARQEGTDFRSVLIEFREGGLRVSAQDLGPKAQLMSDDGEYEFWVDVPPEALQKLAATLIQKRFQGDLGAVRNFMKLCETEGITHQYWSW